MTATGRRALGSFGICLIGLVFQFVPAQAGHHLRPDFKGITRWFNTTAPPTGDQLKGKVILVTFWTYSCINCIRTMPYLKSWYEQYRGQGLEIIGVHTPEFHFEKDPDNVRAAIARFQIPYPVAMDDHYQTWDAYGGRTWPSDFLIDRKGLVRFQHFGEMNYSELDKQLQLLLAEGGPARAGSVGGVTAPSVDFSRLKTPQIYLGLLRLASLGNTERVVPGQPQTFGEPRQLRKHRAHLVGAWSFGRESVQLVSTEGKLILRFDANKANLVLATEAGRAITAEVWIDGRPATNENKGTDVSLQDGKALCHIQESRMYNLVQTNYGEHTLELRFRGPGIKAYTITFG